MPTLLRAAIESVWLPFPPLPGTYSQLHPSSETTSTLRRFNLVSGCNFNQVTDAMAEGELAGVLRRTGESSGQYQFAIELVRDVLCDRLSGASRDWLHFGIAEALETLRQRGAGIATEDLAFHFFKGAALGRADEAVEYSRRSASQVIRRGDFQGAARFYALALAAAEFVQNYEEAKRWELLLALAGSQARSDDPSGAVTNYERALEIAERVGDPEGAALATLGLSQLSEMPAGVSGRQHERLVTDTENPQSRAVNHVAQRTAIPIAEGAPERLSVENGAALLSFASSVKADLCLAGGSAAALARGSAKELSAGNPTQTSLILDRTFRREGDSWTISYRAGNSYQALQGAAVYSATSGQSRPRIPRDRSGRIPSRRAWGRRKRSGCQGALQQYAQRCRSSTRREFKNLLSRASKRSTRRTRRSDFPG